MKYLQEKILHDGVVLPGEILKVGGFLNHLIDDDLMDKIGAEIAALFSLDKINKILTIEASGIAVACYTARHIHCPVLFAKKEKTSNVSGNVYMAEVKSYTHNRTNTIIVEKPYLTKEDKVLIVDDFLARGEAMRGLISLVNQAGAELVGCAAVIEKGFQNGGADLRKEGIHLESLAIIDKMTDTSITFRD